MSFNMYVPTRFVFGNGRLSELSQYKMPGKKQTEHPFLKMEPMITQSNN